MGPCYRCYLEPRLFFTFNRWYICRKRHSAHAIHSEMRPLYGDKWPDEGNAEWTEICLRYGGVVGRSSVACAAADFVFLHRAFTNLLKDGTNV